MHAAFARPTQSSEKTYQQHVNNAKQTHRFQRPKSCVLGVPARHTSRIIRQSPDYDAVALVRRVAKDLVQHHGKPVQMPDVQRSEVVVERVVEERVFDVEVDGRVLSRSDEDGLLHRLARRLRAGFRGWAVDDFLLDVGERGARCGRAAEGGEVYQVCEGETVSIVYIFGGLRVMLNGPSIYSIACAESVAWSAGATTSCLDVAVAI